MGDHHSQDIYTLIHSLSQSEWSTLIHEVGNSPSYNLVNEKAPVYIEVIQYLKTQPQYDDIAAKTHFGYEDKQPARWRDVKRNAIVAIFKAIDRAGENQTKRYQLQKAPLVIQKLIEKELWKRAEKTTTKFIKTAQELEQFDILIQLLSLQQLIVSTIYPETGLIAELSNLQEKRSQTRVRLQNIEVYQDIWFKLSGFARKRNIPAIQEIHSSEAMQKPSLLSDKAKRVYLQSWQMAVFSLGLNDEYQQSIQEGIQFCTPRIENSEEFETITFFIKLHFEKCLNSIHRKDIPASEDSITKLEYLMKVKELPNSLRTMCKERLLLLRLNMARVNFDRGILFPVAKELEKWYVESNATTGEGTILRLSFRCAESLFLVEDYSLAVKWLVRIRNEKQSTFRPRISSAAWMFYLLIRFEQEEWEILSSQILSTKKYLETYEPENEYYWELLYFFENTSGIDKEAVKSNLSSLQKRLSELRTLPRYAKLESYFHCSIWIESKLINQPFLTLFQHYLGSEESPI